MTLDTAPIKRLVPIPTAKPGITDIVIRDIGKFKLGTVASGDIARRPSEAYMTGNLAFRVGAGGAVLTFGAVGGGVVPGRAAEVVVGFLRAGVGW